MEIGRVWNAHGTLLAFCCRRVLCAVANAPRCDDSTDAKGGWQRGVCPRSQRSVPRAHAVPSARRKVPRRLLVKRAATGSERHEKPNPVPSFFFFPSGIVIDCAPPYASCERLGRAGGTDDASCVCLKMRGKRRKDHSDETDLEYAVWLGVSAAHVWCAFRVAHLFSFSPVATVYLHRWCARGFVWCAGCRGTLWSCSLLIVAQNDEMSVWMVLLVGQSSVRNDSNLSVLDGLRPSDVEKVCRFATRREAVRIFKTQIVVPDKCDRLCLILANRALASPTPIWTKHRAKHPFQWPYREIKSTDSSGSESEQILYPLLHSCHTFDTVLYLAVREAFERSMFWGRGWSVIRGNARCICKIGLVAFWVGKSLAEKKFVKSNGTPYVAYACVLKILESSRPRSLVWVEYSLHRVLGAYGECVSICKC